MRYIRRMEWKGKERNERIDGMKLVILNYTRLSVSVTGFCIRETLRNPAFFLTNHQL